MKKIKIALQIILTLLLTASCANAAQIGTSDILLRSSTSDGTRCTELSLGSFCADAVREYTNADLAIWCVGESKLNLQPGIITDESLADSIREDREVISVTVTPSQLREFLEVLLSHIVLNDSERIDQSASDFAGFPQISGFLLKYDASAPVGTRIVSLCLEDGTPLSLSDTETELTLAGSRELLSGEYETANLTDGKEPAYGTQRSIVAQHIRLLGNIEEEPSSGRITVIGARENNLLGDGSHLSSLALVAVLVIFLIPKLRMIPRSKK